MDIYKAEMHGMRVCRALLVHIIYDQAHASCQHALVALLFGWSNMSQLLGRLIS